MADKKSEGVTRWLLGEGASQGLQAAVQALWPYLLPLLIAAMTFASRWLAEPLVPWPYIITATVVAFAAMTYIVMRFVDWRRANNPDHKLHPGPLFVAARKSSLAEPPRGLSLGFQVRNAATFPMSYRVEKIHTTIGNLFNPNPTYKTREFTVSESNTAFFYDDEIKKPSHGWGAPVLTGTLSYTLSYGRVGIRKYKLNKQYEISIAVDDAGNVVGANWMEVEPKE